MPHIEHIVQCVFILKTESECYLSLKHQNSSGFFTSCFSHDHNLPSKIWNFLPFLHFFTPLSDLLVKKLLFPLHCVRKGRN